MASQPLFTDDDAPDPKYVNIRAAGNKDVRRLRMNCEGLWERYEKFADTNFASRFRQSFDACYWEMYLTVSLIDMGFKVCCPKPGPDVGIVFDGGRRIWFEATMPTRGAKGTADQVPEPLYDGEFHEVPHDQILLRYLNSISTKYCDQYSCWLENGTVGRDDAFIIAINPWLLWRGDGNTRPPRILEVAFQICDPYVAVDQKSLKEVDSGYLFRCAITKKSNSSNVETGVFLNEKYAGLSGLLCSKLDVANQPDEMGKNFQLVPNPKARVQLPSGFRLRGTYFRVEKNNDEFVVTPEAGLDS
jgi:hypothetical protein